MRLYVPERLTNNRLYLSYSAPSRHHLVQQIGSPYFKIDEQYYTVNEVKATPQTGDTLIGTIIGCILGSLAGGLGIILGGIGGSLIGLYKDSIEMDKVDSFENSRIDLK